MFPNPTDYPPFFDSYIQRVSGSGTIKDALEKHFPKQRKWLESLSEAQLLHRYAPGKWTIKEVIGHLIDTERIMAYRALRIARGDKTPLAGFDENRYVPAGQFNRRSIQDLMDEWASVREASLTFLNSLDEETLQRKGIANDLEISVNALFYIMAGHPLHHMAIIKDRYL
jgi:uncharacterized damage-inducible protein DinB